ncbi:uncharacterized protein PGTG_10077 [Puccinia graminis f. sp. tritici CRL 75-36-700-3]|uniref:Uncharacterized protein n=2 Tax=Puccinia graminis f. sp. tritici TaxID=56615 RepID=E3KJ82_PUCGT|nr:uncharacterized protein PGTG_10077 [Puccinia graminis f. sp. tritici CRL 75-36-700-3]EFP84357.1 hypothetical protein PGTG_10077 [Puccinia graminis f. sp. tritici CRL 75-36-700-3]
MFSYGDMPDTAGWNTQAQSALIPNQTLLSACENPPNLNLSTSGLLLHSAQSNQSQNNTHQSQDDEDGLRAMMADNAQQRSEQQNPETIKLNRPTHSHQLTDADMERFAKLGLAELRVASDAYATRGRMTEDMKAKVNDLYYDFQCDVVKLAIHNRVGVHLYFEHLGQSRRVRGGSTWNNFQKYDSEAQKLFDEYGRVAGAPMVSALWNTKTQAEKDRYLDLDFLNTLREVVTDESTTSVPPEPTTSYPSERPKDPSINASRVAARLNGRIQSSNALQQKTLTMTIEWVQKVESDLKSLSFFHQMEGILLVASRHPKSTFFRKIGSPLGNGYLDMLADQPHTDAAAEFHTWVATQAILINKGIEPAVPRKKRTKPVDEITEKFRVGNLADNISAIRAKLKELIHTASGRKLHCAWPGEDSANRLRDLKISVRIDENDWNIEPSDLCKPLVQIKGGTDVAILACLGLNKIHLTYHPEWDSPPRTHKKSATGKKSKSANQKNSTNTNGASEDHRRRTDDDQDTDNDSEGEDDQESGEDEAPARKRKRAVVQGPAATKKQTAAQKKISNAREMVRRNARSVRTDNTTNRLGDQPVSNGGVGNQSVSNEAGSTTLGGSADPCLDPLLNTLA